MKKILFGLVLAFTLLSSISCKDAFVTVYAQTLPVTKTLAWNANATSEGVINYTVRLDTVVIGNPTGTTQQVTINTAGPHVLTVTATNQWGTSPPATLNINVVIPTAPQNLNIQ